MRSLLVLGATFIFAHLVFAESGREAVQMLVPGFEVREIPVKLSNQNNLRFAPDGTLTSLGYDGKIWRLRDSDGDGLEDSAEPLWDKETLSVPLGMAWSTHGLYVSSKGKISLLKDSDGDGKMETEEIIAADWPMTDVGSGGVDATAVTLDRQGNLFFGLLVADYSNAYRLRSRRQLSAAEIDWLKQEGRWRDPAPGNENEEFSLYDLQSPRGTIQKWDAGTRRLSTIATGIRVPVALVFNQNGDLFNTDQEGETWMPHGNPLDELNHIVAGRNYGFPPAHPKWLPNLRSEAPVVGFGPQHQSACGLVFNEPHAAYGRMGEGGDHGAPLPIAPKQDRFGPPEWAGDALVAGGSRGKIWRVRLAKGPNGYMGTIQTIARLSMLTMDLAISPRGELYVACHSGNPDWGTGPRGEGKIFQIRHKDPALPIPLAAWPSSATEVRIAFNKPLDSRVRQGALSTNAMIEFGEYVTAGDRFEVLKPPYAVVQQQDAAPRSRLAIRDARLDQEGRVLTLITDPHPLAVRYALTLPAVSAPGPSANAVTIDIDYDFLLASQPRARDQEVSLEAWSTPVVWAPKGRASGGTDSRAVQRPDGDWEHGRDLFFGAEFQCSKCHRIRGEGGTAGPDLSNLIHRDPSSVLRDIREPSATIHPDYVTYRVATRSGETMEGFIRAQTAGNVRLFDANGNETAVPRAVVSSIQPTEVSLMPVGLLEGRKEGEVRDLLTFLLWEPPQRQRDSFDELLSSLKTRSGKAGAPRIVLVASKQDHGSGQHDYPYWQTNWVRLISETIKGSVVETAWEWPSLEQFRASTVIVFYFWNHDWSDSRLGQLDQYLESRRGLVFLHAAVIADKDPEHLAARIGLSAQPGRTGYRHMPFSLQIEDKSHPATTGLPETLEMLDEPYWPMIGNTNDVHLLASAVVDSQKRPLVWTKQTQGRIFASVPGHYTRTLDDPAFRALILRGIAWAAKLD